MPRIPGFQHSEETKLKISLALTGENNGKWKGYNAELWYPSLHRWVRRHIFKPDKCEICNERSPFDLANKTGIYNRDFSNWYWLCRRCHMLSDGRMNNLKQYGND